MGLLDRFLEKRLEGKTAEITKTVTGELVKHVDDSMFKASGSSSPYLTGDTGLRGVKRYQFTQDMINGGIQRRKKPGSNISFETLRAFSVNHEVSRACINFRKRQITGMEWNIGTDDPEDTKNYDAQIKEVKAFFDSVGGRGIGYRKFLDRFIEDIMVLDAVSLEKQPNRGGGLYNIIPIDAATIRLRVDESGAMPEPPETAFVQVIRGQITAEFTADEMIYELMNPRNDTPYGLAPLESLMIIVNSSLKAGMYNLAYLTDGNIPEGFFTMPETWQPQQIKDFQEYFDALMAGDETMTRRLKFMPQGDYSPTKKPEDMAFSEFNDWLMKITCALFEINPIDIGFSPKTGLGGKGFSEQQNQGSHDKGLLPMAQFIEEVFTTIIHEDFGYDFLKFNFPTLQQKDERATAEVNEILIRSGQRTVNELRTDDGLDPIDGLDKPFVNGQITWLDEESQIEQSTNAAMAATKPPTTQKPTEPDDQTPDGKGTPDPTNKVDGGGSFERVINMREKQIDDLKKFRDYAVKRRKAEKSIRPFESAILPAEMLEGLNKHVLISDLTTVRKAFNDEIKNLQLLSIDSALDAKRALV